MNRILEVNVDDMGFGGVYSLVRNVILAKPAGTTLDIACIEPFEQQKNIDELADHSSGRAGMKRCTSMAMWPTSFSSTPWQRGCPA